MSELILTEDQVRVCPQCPNAPTCSLELAKAIVARLTPDQVKHVKETCVAWLVNRDDGLLTYSGITGETAYHWAVKDLVTAELWVVEDSACPFAKSDGCQLRGASTLAGWEQSYRAKQWSWLPTYLLKVIDRDLLIDLTRNRLVADAKVAALNQRKDFPRPRDSTNQPYVAEGIGLQPILS